MHVTDRDEKIEPNALKRPHSLKNCSIHHNQKKDCILTPPVRFFCFRGPKRIACKWSPSFSPFDCRLMVIFDRAQSRRVSYAYALWSGPHIIMFCFLSGGTSTRPLESSLLLDSCNVIVCLLETKCGIHCPFIALISLANLLMRLLGLLPHMLLLQLVVRP